MLSYTTRAYHGPRRRGTWNLYWSAQKDRGKGTQENLRVGLRFFARRSWKSSMQHVWSKLLASCHRQEESAWFFGKMDWAVVSKYIRIYINSANVCVWIIQSPPFIQFSYMNGKIFLYLFSIAMLGLDMTWS